MTVTIAFARRTALAAAVALGTVGIATTAAYAATDGQLGQTSTGSLNISLQKNALYRISNLDDIAFSAWTGSDLTQQDSVCVYGSHGNQYRITATGSGSGGSFRLDNNGQQIEYNVLWSTTTSGNSFQSLTAGQPAQGLSNLNQNDVNCNGSTNARVRIDIPANSNNAQAQTGTYTGTLTLTVAAN